MQGRCPAENKPIEFSDLVHDGVDTVIFEGGWWMKKSDQEKIWYDERGNKRTFANPAIGISRDEETHQLKIFYIPL